MTFKQVQKCACFFIKVSEMLFLEFNSDEERRKYGGSEFLEMQFCRMKNDASIKDIVSVESIEYWRCDSLYIHDMNSFYGLYGDIFDCGVYANLKCGRIDIYGINYYAPNKIRPLIERVKNDAPTGHEKLLEWLEEAQKYNGFYILGI
jgi:hypothetical protein